MGEIPDGPTEPSSQVPPGSDVASRVEAFTQDADLSWFVDMLTERRDEILGRWLNAASEQPFHRSRSERAVADHIPTLFDALGRLLSRYSDRSGNPGVPLEDSEVLAAAQSHARMRLEQGFDAPDVATEFRLLRQEIGRALRAYVSDRSPTSDVIGAEMLMHDALDGAVFLALSVLGEHEVARRRAELALRDSEERFRLLVESVADYAIFTLDPDGRVASWNAGAQAIFGYERDAIVGQPVERVFTDQDITDGTPGRLLASASAEGRATGDGERRRADGSLFHAEAAVTALRDDDGSLVGFAMVMHDVTGARGIEAARTAAANEREAFFATLGHDLKSPLVSAIAIAQLLGRQATKGTLGSEQLVTRLSAIEASLRKGSLRVDELMDLARGDRTDALSLHLGPVDLVALVTDVLDRYRLANDRHEIVFAPAVAALVGEWDRDRIERSIDNLVSNAVKFSPAAGRITASVDRDDAEAVVSIADHGLGIPDDELEAVFARFRRGSNVSGVPGSGVGLWSVRRIAEQHGGSLAVESRIGLGSTFTLRLPLSPGR